jgi:hypothetical protein
MAAQHGVRRCLDLTWIGVTVVFYIVLMLFGTSISGVIAFSLVTTLLYAGFLGASISFWYGAGCPSRTSVS